MIFKYKIRKFIECYISFKPNLIMDEYNAFFSFLNELHSLPLFPFCYNNQKNFQSSVALIFRVNPEFCSFEHDEAIQKNNSSPISIEILKNILEECLQNRKENEKKNVIAKLIVFLYVIIKG